MMNLKNKKILLTGGSGFLGKYVFDELISSGVHKKNIFIPRSKTFDLRELKNIKKAVKNKDIIIHLAGTVGGIGFNKKNPGKMIYDNLIIGLQLIEQARLAKIKKIVLIGTVCCYPKITPIPFKEKNLWDGYPEETNAPYGLAKKILLVMADAYKKQYNLNSIFLIPANLYGPGDKFDLYNSHVIPALIRKISSAKRNNQKKVVIWGTGKASREFLYVKDCAKAIIVALKKYNKVEPINLGSGKEITIKKLAILITECIGYHGRIIWDKTKPDGQPRRRLDTSKAQKEFGFKAKTNFISGLKRTIAWYNKQNV